MSIEIAQSADRTIEADKICRYVGWVLKKHYPNRDWYVDVSLSGGVIKIQSPSISMNYGFVLHLDKNLMVLEKDVVRAGGQILEMFKLSREKGAKGGEELILRDARGEALQAAGGL